jgi:SanA protein
MLYRIFKVLSKVLLLIAAFGLLLLAAPRLITSLHAWKKVLTVETVPTRRVAIVFGAGLQWDGSPTAVLRDRVAVAARLYFDGKVEKLLLSGDNSTLYYNEPGAMQQYGLELGIPEEDMVLDYAGRRTYDTCYRAHEIFGVQEAILVTQGFHLPRALYTCNRLGVSSVGVPADLRPYLRRARLYWSLREIPATLVALWEVHLARPLPILGDPEPIFPPKAQ